MSARPKSRRKSKPSQESPKPRVRRTTNVRLLLITIGLVIIAVPSVWLWHRYQVSRTANIYLSQARLLESQGDWGKAAEYVDRYLRLRPSDSEQRVRLADTYHEFAEQEGDRSRAIDLYYQALGAASDGMKPAIREKLSELLLEEQRYSEAAEVAGQQKLSEDAPSESHIRVRAVAAYENYLNDKATLPTDALPQIGADLEQANQNDPGDTVVARRLADLYREHAELLSADHQHWSQSQRELAADNVMDALLKAAPDDVQALTSHYTYFSTYYDDHPTSELEKAAELDPDNVTVLLSLGAALQDAATNAKNEQQANAKLREARLRYEQVVRSRPELAGGHVGLGEAYEKLGEIDKALAAWQKGLETSEEGTAGSLDLAYHRASLLITQNRIEEAEKALDVLADEFVRTRSRLSENTVDEMTRIISLLRGQWSWSQGDAGAAIAALREVTAGERAQSDESGVAFASWMLLGSIYDDLRQFEQASFAYGRAAVLRPDLPAPLIAAGANWASAGRTAEAIKALMRASQMPAFDELPASEQGRVMAILAHQELQAVLEQPESGRNWRSFDQARARAKAYFDDGSIDDVWRLSLLDLEAAQVREGYSPEETVAALKELEQQFDAPPFQRQLAEQYETLGASDEADRILQQLLDAESPASPETLGVQARLLARRDQENAMDALMEASRDVTDQQRDALSAELVRTFIEQGDFEQALQQLESRYADDPDMQRAEFVELQRLAELSLLAGDTQRALKYERLLRQRAPDLESVWQVAQARRLVVELKQLVDPATDPRLGQLADVIADIERRQPSWPPLLVLKGELETIRGDRDAAIDNYLEAIRLGDRSVRLFERVVALLTDAGRYSEVMPLLTQMKSRQSMSDILVTMGLQVATETGDLSLAEQMVRDALADRQGDARAMIWLGEVLRMRGDLEESESMFRKAVQAAPEDPSSWFALFRLLRLTERTEEAEEVLTMLGEKAELDDTQRAVALAQGYQALGDIERAKELFQQAEQLSPEDFGLRMLLARFYTRLDPAAAERQYRQALELEPGDLAARRQLAILLMNQGADRWDEAKQLLAAAGTDSADDLANNRRIQAMMLFERGAADDLEQARQLVEQIGDDDSYTPGDRFLLSGILLRQAGDEPDEERRRERMEDVEKHLKVLTEGDDAAYVHLGAHITFLLQNDRPQETRSLLNKYSARLRADQDARAEDIARFIDLQLACSLDLGEEAAMPEAQLTRLEKMDPNGIVPLRLRMKQLMINDDKEAARKAMEDFANSLPDFEEVNEQLRTYEQLGDLCWQMQLYESAEQWYRKLVELEPKFYDKLANALARLGRGTEAIELCRKMAGDNELPQNPAVLASAIMIGQDPSSENISRAIEVLQEAHEEKRDSIPLKIALAGAYAMSGEEEKAVRELRRVQQLDPDHLDAMNDLSVLLSLTGRAEEGLELADRALRIHGNRVSLYATKALALVELGRLDEGIALLQRAVAGDPQNTLLRLHLAIAFDKAGDQANAAQTLSVEAAERLAQGFLTPRDRQWITAFLSANQQAAAN